VKGGFIARVSRLLAIFLFARCLALACSIQVLLHVVRQTFVVIVEDRGKSISGADVKLLRWNDAKMRYDLVKSVQSDVNGTALFSAAPLGEYRVEVSHGFVRGGDTDVKIVSRGDAEDTIELSWPAAEIHQVQTPSGAFTVAVDGEPLSGADISLTEAWASRRVGETATDEQGRFGFDGVKPGIYGLSISERTEEEGYLGIMRDMMFEHLGIQQQRRAPRRAHINGGILIEVSKKARDRQLPRGSLSMSDCGMFYEPERVTADTK